MSHLAEGRRLEICDDVVNAYVIQIDTVLVVVEGSCHVISHANLISYHVDDQIVGHEHVPLDIRIHLSWKGNLYKHI